MLSRGCKPIGSGSIVHVSARAATLGVLNPGLLGTLIQAAVFRHISVWRFGERRHRKNNAIFGDLRVSIVGQFTLLSLSGDSL